jgi:hypothetical protein
MVASAGQIAAGLLAIGKGLGIGRAGIGGPTLILIHNLQDQMIKEILGVLEAVVAQAKEDLQAELVVVAAVLQA